LLPTLVDLCKIELSEDHHFDGKSLVPLLTNENSTWEKRNIYTIHTEGEMRIRPAAVRTDNYRMVIDYDGNALLFDMKKDASEKNDLAKQKPKIVDSLKNDLEKWFKDVTQKGIKPSLTQVGHNNSLTTQLPAPEAKINGHVLFKGDRGWANDYIINWNKKNDQASWEIDVIKNGEFEFFIKYNCSKEFLPANFKIKIGENEKVFKIEKAFNNEFFSSPDRVKRGEVYEKEWGKISVGKFDLKKGKQEVRLQLQNEQTEGWMEIKGVEIRESNEN